MERFYITTPIYYVNAKPHLGHAYTTIIADTMKRFQQMMGKETFFLTGTDEHGDKIVQAAEKNKCTPQEYVDQISQLFKDLWPELGICNDHFIRTTDSAHKKVVQDVLQKVYDSGDIYFGEYGGHYCYGCERFYTEKELEDGLCPQHQTKPEYIAEKNYFFKMSKYQEWLKQHILDNPEFIRPERYRKEVLSLLDSGELEDLCISRPKSRLEWGVELPFDNNFVTYVWFDALLNYVSALDYPEGENFKKFWPGVQHIVAKDILKPHAIFWPTMLKAAGFEPYNNLNVHGYWLVNDTKMSKSLGNVVAPLDMAKKYGNDTFRFFLLRDMHFGNDASFSEEALAMRQNAELANDLGNLFSRVLSMVKKYFGGVVPQPAEYTEADMELRELASNSCKNFQQLFDNVRFSYGIESLWELVRALNKYVDSSQPWTLAKEGDTARLGTVMYTMLECMRKVAIHLWPVMPKSAEKLVAQLGVEFDPVKANLPAEVEAWGTLPVGIEIAPGSNLFPRIDIDKLRKEIEEATKAAAAAAKKAAAPVQEAAAPIEFDDFTKVDLRVGKVLVVEDHPKADRLFRCEVDLGEEKPRQILAGLKEHFTAEDLLGRQVVVVANLKPRKIRGLESHGMMLALKTADGMEMLTASGEVPAGTKAS
ncbi:methionine--tRNA ligase [Halodesulfovibrio spirochaetisodalis]|uniref:Methionine--tRNA ligase n=1 Tax=Halodesulfovibrio spirochaetisodalis TaxID=1560234 RepID=A0A1B7XPU2_9BACT|nr:methionine--tRNA ligase [Halodesulfovibrio spirochaetisodalis]OBQ57531.1 methionyl-tRNA synthetase [Halodesulfovibrio spirochaetisodalis]